MSMENDGSFVEELGEAKECRNYGKIQPWVEKLSSGACSNASGSSESQCRIKKRSKTTPIKF